MTPILRLRLAIALIGFAVWAVGARAERDGAPWSRSVMTIGLVILAASVAMRFIKPKPPSERPPDPPVAP
jgi:hypothetical protein